MKAQTRLLGWLAAGTALIGAIGCSSMSDKPANELLQDASFHILVSETHSVPANASFEFDTKLFKVSDSLDLDLAAIDRRITNALQTELEAKGFERAGQEPDLWVSYAVAADARISATDLNEAYAKDFPIDFPVSETNHDLHYHQGTVIVDVVDRRHQTLLWRGAIMAGFRLDISDSEKQRRANYGAQALLTHFPQPLLNQN